MATYLVSYDLVGTDDTSDNYEKLIERINEYPDCARVQLSTWLLRSEANAKEVRDDLKGYMHSTDRLFVADLLGATAWSSAKCGSQKVKDLL